MVDTQFHPSTIGEMAEPSGRTDHTQLSWRIPVDEGSLLFRARSVRILVASGIFLALVMIFGGQEIRQAALIALAPLVLVLVWWARKSSVPKAAPPDNIRLDAAGLHWKNEFGGENKIPRDEIEGFRIGLDPDTVRAIPALTLILNGGFESQPVELHEPATPDRVRRLLHRHWQLPEVNPEHSQFANNLRASLLAAFHSQSTAEFQFLRYSLVSPTLQPDGNWLVCDAELLGQLRYEPLTCRFQFLQNGKATALAGVEEVTAHVRDHVLPAGFERRDLLSKMDAQSLRRERRALAEDARQAGYYAECDRFGNVHFIGSRNGLLAFCDKLAGAAESFRSAPAGAKSPSCNVGGPMMPVEIELREQPLIYGESISGPPAYLKDLAKRFREKVVGADIDSDFTFRAFDSPRSKVTFHVIVKSDAFDPGSIAEQVV